MNEDKIVRIISIIIMIILITVLLVYKYIPEYKSSKGSSDNYLNITSFQEIVKLELSTGPQFILITNDEDKLINILFINKQSLCLYNKNIENNTIENSLVKIFKKLNNNYYLNNVIIKITSYNDQNLKNKIIKLIKENYDNILIEEENENLTSEEKINYLNEQQEKSQKNIRNYNNDKIISNIENNISEEDAYKYAENIYLKLQKYALKIENQEKNSPNFPIQLISGATDKNIYPSSKSWYYISNGKVFSYINFTSEEYDYSYCCQNNEILRGKCQ